MTRPVGSGARVALELAPLVADKDIDFDIETQPAAVQAHDWMLRELSRNLLHNAIKHTPAGGALSVRVMADARTAALVVSDTGPGIPPSFSRACSSPSRRETCAVGPGWAWPSATRSWAPWAARIELENREKDRRTAGLDATVRLPLAQNRP